MTTEVTILCVISDSEAIILLIFNTLTTNMLVID